MKWAPVIWGRWQKIAAMPEDLSNEVKEWIAKVIDANTFFIGEDKKGAKTRDGLPFGLAKNGEYTLVGIRGAADLFTDNPDFQKDEGNRITHAGVYFLARGPLTELPIRNPEPYTKAYEKWAAEHFAQSLDIRAEVTPTDFTEHIPSEPIAVAAERMKKYKGAALLPNNEKEACLHLSANVPSDDLWAAAALSAKPVIAIVDGLSYPSVSGVARLPLTVATVKSFSIEDKRFIKDEKITWPNKPANTLGSIPPIPPSALTQSTTAPVSKPIISPADTEKTFKGPREIQNALADAIERYVESEHFRKNIEPTTYYGYTPGTPAKEYRKYAELFPEIFDLLDPGLEVKQSDVDASASNMLREIIPEHRRHCEEQEGIPPVFSMLQMRLQHLGDDAFDAVMASQVNMIRYSKDHYPEAHQREMEEDTKFYNITEAEMLEGKHIRIARERSIKNKAQTIAKEHAESAVGVAAIKAEFAAAIVSHNNFFTAPKLNQVQIDKIIGLVDKALTIFPDEIKDKVYIKKENIQGRIIWLLSGPDAAVSTEGEKLGALLENIQRDARFEGAELSSPYRQQIEKKAAELETTHTTTGPTKQDAPPLTSSPSFSSSSNSNNHTPAIVGTIGGIAAAVGAGWAAKNAQEKKTQGPSGTAKSPDAAPEKSWAEKVAPWAVVFAGVATVVGAIVMHRKGQSR